MSFAVSQPDEPAREPDELAQALAWAIVGSFAIWAGWGWVADGLNAMSLMLAVVFGLFQVATNILAVKVRELAARGAYITMLAAFAAMIATGLLTHESLNHAYEITLREGYASADPELMSWLLLVVPYLEPLLFWINRILVEPARAEPVIRLGLIPALMLVLFGPGQAQAHAPEPPPPEPITRQITKNQARMLDDGNRATAALMIRQGQKPRLVHETTGVPLSTLKRWAKAA